MSKARKPKLINTSFNTEIAGKNYNICLISESDTEVGIFTPQHPQAKGNKYLAVIPYDENMERLKAADREAVAIEIEAAIIAVEIAVLSIQDGANKIAADTRAEFAPAVAKIAKQLRSISDKQERTKLECHNRADLCLSLHNALYPYSMATKRDILRTMGVPEAFLAEGSVSLPKIAEWLIYVEIENQNAAEAEISVY